MGFKFKYMSIPAKNSDLFDLYEKLGWNDYLKLSEDKMTKAMNGSLFCIYVYDGNLLVGTGRVISDGIINAYICGIGVLPSHRNLGIGSEIISRLSGYCRDKGLHVQLVCESDLVQMYKKFGYEEFAVALKLKEET